VCHDNHGLLQLVQRGGLRLLLLVLLLLLLLRRLNGLPLGRLPVCLLLLLLLWCSNLRLQLPLKPPCLRAAAAAATTTSS
jgi:hypothetical protein